MPFRLILASSSPYRRELLERFKIPFEVVVPAVDETPFEHEKPDVLAMRLGAEKCSVVARQYPNAWVIGSDQVASSEGVLFGKPGNHERALEQLKALQGKQLDLFTSLAVWNPNTQGLECAIDYAQLRFSTLPETVLDAYLKADQPYQCAASAKIESMGVGLLDSLQTSDPTAIIGLPLIALTKILRAGGIDVLASSMI